jgi:hypothetical protein
MTFLSFNDITSLLISYLNQNNFTLNITSSDAPIELIVYQLPWYKPDKHEVIAICNDGKLSAEVRNHSLLNLYIFA